MHSPLQAPEAGRISVVLTFVALGASACALAWVIIAAFVPLLATGA